jgi:AraC-like DNA-binding protein
MIFAAFSENVLWLICGIGVLQGVLLALLLYFHPKSERSVNKFLALFILMMTTLMGLSIFMRVAHWQSSFFMQPMPLLMGPCLWFYVRSFSETITWRKAWPHLIPFVFLFFPAYFNIAHYAAKYPNERIVPREALHSPIAIIANYGKFLQSLIYIYLSYRTLVSYQKSIRQLFSNITRINLDWIRLLIFGFLVLVLSAIAILSIMLNFHQYFTILLLTSNALTTIYIYLATYKGLLQPTIWQVQPGVTKEKAEAEMQEAEKLDMKNSLPEESKTVRSGLNQGKMDEIVSKINFLLEKEKIYQESELTLQQLADKLQTPTYLVSQAINDGTNKNFYELINGYRVDEAKKLLLDPKNRNFTILSVAFEAGFNSKTTFNTVFKKFTGQTPTDFRESRKVLN